MVQDVQVAVSDEESDTEQDRFLFDYDGDGLMDFFVRDRNKHMGLRLLQPTKNGLRVGRGFAWHMTIPEKSQLLHETATDITKPVLLVIGARQITYVRFE
jgi:hypothetical protein